MQSDDPVTNRNIRGLGPVSHPEFGKHTPQMVFDRVLRNVNMGPDGFVRQAFRQHRQDFNFPIRETVENRPNFPGLTG